MVNDPPLGREIVGKYRIDAEIGAGGMATIYRATRLHIGDVVAIKVLRSELLRDPQFAERFRREAQAAARLKHPNVVAIYDFGVAEDGVIYLVMELLEGRSLRTIIKDAGPVSTPLAAEIAREVCAALGEAHRQGTVHRDIKPANIMVESTPDGVRVKVLDFGIASLRSGSTYANLTQTGVLLGTPAYMSPEQCLGEELDGRSDIYSLGIVLFEMLCGVVPFNSPTATAVVMQHVQQEPPPLRILNISVPPPVERAVLRALAKRREDRPQSARAFADELGAAVAGGAMPSAPPYHTAVADLDLTQQISRFIGPESSSRHYGRTVLIGAATIALLIVAFAAQRSFTGRQESTTRAASVSRHVAAIAPHRRAAVAYRPPRPLPIAPLTRHRSARYAQTACGAIVDTRTGLQWLVGPDSNLSWDAAQSWIAGAPACGGGWGMPSIGQLATLYEPSMSAGVGYERGGVHYPAHIDPVFNGIGSGSWVWSRETYPGGSARSFNFNQGLGVVYARDNNTYTTRAFAVRAASGGAHTAALR